MSTFENLIGICFLFYFKLTSNCILQTNKKMMFGLHGIEWKHDYFYHCFAFCFHSDLQGYYFFCNRMLFLTLGVRAVLFCARLRRSPIALCMLCRTSHVKNPRAPRVAISVDVFIVVVFFFVVRRFCASFYRTTEQHCTKDIYVCMAVKTKSERSCRKKC